MMPFSNTPSTKIINKVLIYNLLGGVTLNSILLLSILIIKELDVENTGITTSGFIVFVANVCRVAVVAILGVSFITLGNLALRYQGKSSLINSQSNIGLVDFFAGSSLYGLLFFLLGLLGLIDLKIAFLVVSPILFIATTRIRLLLQQIVNSFTGLRKSTSVYFFLSILACLLIAFFAIGLRIAISGIYPLAGDGDVWIHYFQYIRSVLETGTTLPGSLWYHFYLSKGSGLFFLAGLFTDSGAPQLVSSLFFFISSLLLVEILIFSSVSYIWSLVGVTIYCFLYDGVFFKSHVIIASYVAFLILICLKSISCNKNQLREYTCASLISGVYLGFCHPIPALLIMLFISITYLFFLGLKDTYPTRILLIKILCSIGTSTLSVFILNYLMTGLIEHVPLSLMWKYKNESIFRDTYGIIGPLFFLSEQRPASILSFLSINIDWYMHIFRLKILQPHIPIIWIFSLPILFLAQITRPTVWAQINKLKYLSLLILSLSLASLILAQAQQVGSVYRSLSYLTLITTIVLVIFFYIIFFPIKNHYFLILPIVFSFLFFYLFLISVKFDRLNIIYESITGKSSLYATLLKEKIEPVRVNQLDLFIKIRKKLGVEKKIWSLVQVVDPSMAFPYPGILSEPSNDLGPKALEILTSNAKNSRDLLINLGINYFYLPSGDNSNALLSSLIFSNLFDPAELKYRFSVFSYGDSGMILTWKRNDLPEIPSKAIQSIAYLRSKEMLGLLSVKKVISSDAEAHKNLP